MLWSSCTWVLVDGCGGKGNTDGQYLETRIADGFIHEGVSWNATARPKVPIPHLASLTFTGLPVQTRLHWDCIRHGRIIRVKSRWRPIIGARTRTGRGRGSQRQGVLDRPAPLSATQDWALCTVRTVDVRSTFVHSSRTAASPTTVGTDPIWRDKLRFPRPDPSQLRPGACLSSCSTSTSTPHLPHAPLTLAPVYPIAE